MVFKIFTLEGTMKASVGDYIIRGVNGEHYPCKPDIFEKTYEPEGSNNTLQATKVAAVREFAGWCENEFILDDVDANTAARIFIEQLKEQGE